jgi:tetratricopeptide (TPR) repeat protein
MAAPTADDIEANIAEAYRISNSFSVDADIKQEQIQQLVDRVLQQLQQLASAEPEFEQSLQLYWRGKILDALPAYSPEAETCLSKAVKLQPSMIGAWNSLGNCFWKKKDLVAAKNCFVGAIAQQKNKESLRKLSILLRNMPCPNGPAERSANLKESVDRAKAAIGMDIKDGESWYILGNAYLTLCFGDSQDLAHIEAALKAYQKAEASSQHKNPDLYFSRANVFRFTEDYADAVRGYRRAVHLDKSLPAQEQIESIEERHQAQAAGGAAGEAAGGRQDVERHGRHRY